MFDFTLLVLIVQMYEYNYVRLNYHQANDPKCDTLGWKCIPLAVESYGNWGLEARQAFSHLASRLSFGIGHQKSKTLVEIYGKLNVTLVRCNARALLSKACNLV